MPKAESGSIFPDSRLGLLVKAHHDRDVRAIDVRIKEADAGTGLGQSDGHVDTHRRLPTPPLPALTATMFLTRESPGARAARGPPR